MERSKQLEGKKKQYSHIVMKSKSVFIFNQVIHSVDSFEVFLHHHDGGIGRHPLLVGDIRLYRMEEEKSRIVFITSEPVSSSYLLI